MTVAGHAGSDLTLAGPSTTATLTFTATDWDDAQTVTVTAGHDDDGTDDTATLTHTATGGGYDAATAAVAVTVADDDRGIVLTPAAVTVDEGDATGAQYTVKLAVAPHRGCHRHRVGPRRQRPDPVGAVGPPTP